jgi:pimeloyl-ACP methyl ester carboxylesterase
MLSTMIVAAAILAVLLTAGAIYQLIGTRSSARRFGHPGTMLDVGGQRLHTICAGEGAPAVLFESGVAASSLSWTHLLPQIAQFTRGCAYDRAGLGWSAPPRARRSVDRMLSEMDGVLGAAVGSGPHVLVGHSFGALLVCAYASRHPHNVAGLVLLDPPSEWHEITPERKRLLRGGIQLSRVGSGLAQLGVVRACLALLTGGAPRIPRNFVRVFGPTAARTLERLVGEIRKLPPDVHPMLEAIWCQPKCFRAMADHLAALEEMIAVVGAIRALPDVPLVVLSAGDQPADTMARHRELARLSSRGRHLVASPSGHWIQFDRPDLVAATIRDVVDQARRTNAA